MLNGAQPSRHRFVCLSFRRWIISCSWSLKAARTARCVCELLLMPILWSVECVYLRNVDLWCDGIIWYTLPYTDWFTSDLYCLRESECVVHILRRGGNSIKTGIKSLGFIFDSVYKLGAMWKATRSVWHSDQNLNESGYSFECNNCLRFLCWMKTFLVILFRVFYLMRMILWMDLLYWKFIYW